MRRCSAILATVILLWHCAGCQPLSLETPVESLSPEERQAVELAQAFLTKADVTWGGRPRVRRAEVEQIPGMYGAGVYLVAYPTPANEAKRLGDRAVVVDTKTGRVEFVPRS